MGGEGQRLEALNGLPASIRWNFAPASPLRTKATEDAVAVNKPAGDSARKGAVRKRSQLKTKIAGEEHWTKRSRKTGQFMDQKKDDSKFKGVRRERRA